MYNFQHMPPGDRSCNVFCKKSKLVFKTGFSGWADGILNPACCKAVDVGRNVMKILLLMCFYFFTIASCYANKDPWDKDQSKWTILMKLAYQGDTLRIDSLLSHKQNINSQNINGWTALKVAIKKGQTKTVDFLLRHKADPDLADNEGMTVLMEACINNRLDFVNRLLDNKANPNLRNKVGWTALMGATSFGDIKIIEVLLRHKADINAKRQTDGMTALALAKYNNNNQKINLLTKFGAR